MQCYEQSVGVVGDLLLPYYFQENNSHPMIRLDIGRALFAMHTIFLSGVEEFEVNRPNSSKLLFDNARPMVEEAL